MAETKTMKPTLKTALKAMGEVYERSCFPDDPENANDPDFQAGHREGLKGREDKKLSDPTHPINLELARRGQRNDEAFRTWKRGYWAGVYTHILSGEQEGEAQP